MATKGPKPRWSVDKERSFTHLNSKGGRLRAAGVGVTALVATSKSKLPLLAAFFNCELHGLGDSTKAVDELN